MENIENLKNQPEKREFSEKELSRLAKDFKKMSLKAAAGAVTLPVLIVLTTGAAAAATYFALKDREAISEKGKEIIMEIGNEAQKITQEAFDKLGIDNPFKEKFEFGGGKSGGGGASRKF